MVTFGGTEEDVCGCGSLMKPTGRDKLVGFLQAPRADTMSTSCPDNSQSSAEISIATRPQTSVTETLRGLPLPGAGETSDATVLLVSAPADGASLVFVVVSTATTSSSKPSPPVKGASLAGISEVSAGCDVEAVDSPLSLLSCGRTFRTAAWKRFLPLVTITSAPSQPVDAETDSNPATGPLPRHSDGSAL